ncbi:MAG: serine hydrolase [Pseudomonadota bacterium]
MLRKLLLGLIVLSLAVGAFALWRADDIKRLLAVNSLFSEDRIVGNFSAMDTMFHSRSVNAEGDVEPWLEQTVPLPETVDMAGAETIVADYLAGTATTSLLVIRNGTIVHESYALGTKADDLRISWSMAKSILSVAMGVAVEDGLIELDQPVESYVPALADSAYADVTVRNALNMSSGVRFNEDYLDFWSDINRMGRVLALGGSMDEFAASIDERMSPPGSVRQYVSIDTHVLAMVLRAVTGMPLPDYLGEKVLAPIGLEKQPYYVTDGDGAAFALGGMNMTTRDYARFGQMVLDDGVWEGEQIVSRTWLAQSTAPSAPPRFRDDSFGYGYQWWIPKGVNDVVMARGVYGQFMWIDRAQDILIVKTSANRRFREPGAMKQSVMFLDGLAAHYASQ